MVTVSLELCVLFKGFVRISKGREMALYLTWKFVEKDKIGHPRFGRVLSTTHPVRDDARCPSRKAGKKRQEEIEAVSSSVSMHWCTWRFSSNTTLLDTYPHRLWATICFLFLCIA